MTDSPTGCQSKRCDCYARGVEVGRRTVEDELNAERASIALLATALADAAEGIRLVLNPNDMCHFELGAAELPLHIDPALARGTVRIARDVDPASSWRS